MKLTEIIHNMTTSWIKISHKDVKRISKSLGQLLISSDGNRFHIVWSNPQGYWEAYHKNGQSLKKIIMTTILNPSHRGTVSPEKFNEYLSCSIGTYGLSTISSAAQDTLNVKRQLPNEPLSPIDQSNMNNLQAPSVPKFTKSSKDPIGKIPPGQSPGDNP